jgi:hypothetical protein
MEGRGRGSDKERMAWRKGDWYYHCHSQQLEIEMISISLQLQLLPLAKETTHSSFSLVYDTESAE